MDKHQRSDGVTDNAGRRSFMKTSALSLALAAAPLGGQAIA